MSLLLLSAAAAFAFASAPAPASAAAADVISMLRGGIKVLHASCRLQWTFNETSCDAVSSALVSAAQSMAGDDCGTGEKCKYTLLQYNSTFISAIHTTPVQSYKDDLTIGLLQTGTDCIVNGYSTSETWYAVLDYGTNYCNLHNLAEATPLKFTESVNPDDCTQVDTADCSKY